MGPPQGREWFDLLQRKLLPQLQGPPLLIVAIVGGTNIGKSVIFNHLAGETASAATPLAAGTKHPVCLVPPGCDDPQLLGRLFEHFELHAWQSADDPLDDSPADRIYWRLGTQVPPRLVLVDAPDVDSDVTVNWQRARAIRQTADVLIALLTQQKYNDAAVKQFFRAAVEADKPIIVIFNFCDLQADRDYWPQWLARFCAETGADPELVYVVPYDRAAADELRLPFYRVETEDEGGRMKELKPANVGPLSSFIPHPLILRSFLSHRPPQRAGRPALRRDQDPHLSRGAGARARSGAGPAELLERDPRRGGAVRRRGIRLVGNRDGPRRLAQPARQRAGRGNAAVVGRRSQRLVAAGPRLLSRGRPGHHAAGPRGLDRDGRTRRRSVGGLPAAGAGGRGHGGGKTARRARAAFAGGQRDPATAVAADPGRPGPRRASRPHRGGPSIASAG